MYYVSQISNFIENNGNNKKNEEILKKLNTQEEVQSLRDLNHRKLVTSPPHALPSIILKRKAQNGTVTTNIIMLKANNTEK